MVDTRINNYRLTNICTLGKKGVDEDAKGLTIEKKCENSDSYYVIAFIKYRASNECAYMETVGDRILDVKPDEQYIFFQLVQIGFKIVTIANEHEDYYD